MRGSRVWQSAPILLDVESQCGLSNGTLQPAVAAINEGHRRISSTDIERDTMLAVVECSL